MSQISRIDQALSNWIEFNTAKLSALSQAYDALEYRNTRVPLATRQLRLRNAQQNLQREIHTFAVWSVVDGWGVAPWEMVPLTRRLWM